MSIFDANASGPVIFGDSLPEGLARQVRFYQFTLAQNHRENLGSAALSLPQFRVPEDVQAAMDCYQGTSGNSFTREMNFQRSVPMIQSFGRGQSTMMQDRLVIDGHDRFTFLVLWNDSDSDKRVLEQTLREIQVREADYWIGAYRVRAESLTPVLSEDGHRPDGWVSLARKYALGAYRRHGPLVRSRFDPAIVALPARRFDQIVFVAMHESTEVLLERARTLGWVLPGLAASFLVLFLFGQWTAGRVVSPILALKTILEAIAAGNFSQRFPSGNPEGVPGGRRDEIGSVMKASEKMTEGLRERERLVRLVSDQAMTFLDRRQENQDLGKGRAARGVVLFSDIRGFTTLCEKEGPQAVTVLLNRHFSELTAIISRQGGRVDKFIGDAVQAFFEEETGGKGAGIRAFAAGLLILKRVEELSAERKKAGQFGYRAGVGLAGGLVSLGFMGDSGAEEGRMDFAILGPPVKRAMEMESLTRMHPELPLAIAPEIVSWTGVFRNRLVPLPNSDGLAMTATRELAEEIFLETPSSPAPEIPANSSSLTGGTLTLARSSESGLARSWTKPFWVGLGWMVLLVGRPRNSAYVIGNLRF